MMSPKSSSANGFVGCLLVLGLVFGCTACVESLSPPSPSGSASVQTTPAPSEPDAAPEEPAAAPAPKAKAPAPKPAKVVYRSLSAREFEKVAKDPDSYVGQNFTIYGEVIQFDAATGTDGFRANTGPKRLPIEYGMTSYSENSVLTGSARFLKDVVQGDVFCANVTVLGAYSYDTQIGGSTTCPSFQVGSIAVYGSTK